MTKDPYNLEFLTLERNVAERTLEAALVTKLTGGDIGQLNLYVAAVDDILRQPGHNETVGLLLCTAKNQRVVRYALGRSTSPMAVAGYRYTELPDTERALLPGEAELVEVVEAAVNEFDHDHPT